MWTKLKRLFCDQMAAWSIVFRRQGAAMNWYRRMLALDPDDTLALSSLGYRHALAGGHREALALFDRVTELKPADAEAHFNRGYLLQSMNEHHAALAAFAQAVRIDERHDRAHYGIGLSLIAQNRLAEAVAPLVRNTRLQPMSPFGWYQLARVRHDLGETAEVQRILDHLVTFEPKVARQLERETGLQARPG